MSQLTANSVMPIVSSLPKKEQEVLLQRLQELVQPKPKKKKKTIYDDMPAIWHPDNKEQLIAEIMHGK
ncbi:hypothetical protein [Mesonia mobilis]|uniref:hypothetical protein n=1 Tax=Mesonia mobilis TaxID=369791 RepID=UPI0024B8F18A|nr:hypothetical protein [Mesonia mobilis]